MIWLALLAATVAPIPVPMMFGGPVSSLEKLAVAARRCGYTKAAVTKASFGATVVAIPTSDASDERLKCVMGWLFAHPDLELGFFGNRAMHP